MTTLPQLPPAGAVTPDVEQLPIQQGGITTAITPLALISGTMTAWFLSLPTSPPAGGGLVEYRQLSGLLVTARNVLPATLVLV